MKKILFSLLIFPLFVFGNPKDVTPSKSIVYDLNIIGVYNDFYLELTSADLCPDGQGSGSGYISIYDNVLSINFSASWPTPMAGKIGGIAHIDSYDENGQELNVELGIITSGPVQYKASIISNQLVFLPVGSDIVISGYSMQISEDISTFVYVYEDTDGDGYGGYGGLTIIASMPIPLNFTQNWGDCDDSNVNINPNTVWYYDKDFDGIITDMDTRFGGETVQCERPCQNCVPISPPKTDTNSHWIQEVSYDLRGIPTASSRTYFDDLGKSNVSLSPDFVNNQVWGTEVTYDSFGRPDKSSFVAPSPVNNLGKVGFLSTGTNYPSANANLTNYYSDNNTQEPYQASASQPYSQTKYDLLNPGNVINVVGGNQIAGQWKTGYSYTVPAAQEMYYVYGSDYYDGAFVDGKEEVITKFYKSVGVDANGVENVAFSDGEGKVLASARAGGAISYPVVSLIGTQGFVDVHIPAGITSGISLIGGASLYKIYDLKTGLITTSLTGGNAYRIEAMTPPTTDPKTYISSGIPTYDAGALGITYSVNYYDYSVNVYNKTGQLLKSVQPNGYVLNTSIVAVPAHMAAAATAFMSTYTYNALGQVIQTASPDEGTSRFAYRKDGQIRYSQSALQSDTKVSYTDYDTYGRPKESGVITTAAGIWATANTNVDTVSLIGSLAQRSEQTFTVYDDPTNNLTAVPLPTTPSNLTLTGVLTTAGIPTATYTQNNLSGNVAVTYTKPGTTITAITWYSYDIYGRTEWMVQYNEDLGAKTIHYEYDLRGNINKVIFQKHKATELFAHRYTYDANDVLQKVETSTNNTTFTTHANYSYYQTGELKRVNIAQGAQGIDYVYTLGGALKSINHPSLEAAKDPGGDGLAGSANAAVAPDLFGITLDYYNGDYLRTGRNITTSPTAGADYNGNIKAARWANKSTSMDFNAGAIAQKGYLYNYNRNNWLTGATYGTTDAATATINTSANNYTEAGLTYDPNGNIKSLIRTNNAGAMVDDLTYNYTNVGKNQLNSVTDVVGTTVATTDIDSQPAVNYQYNAIGQMTRNNLENLDYFYNTQGLVALVSRGLNYVVKFYYNERGQRIRKENYGSYPTSNTLQNTTYYSLDLSGNVMAVYTKYFTGSGYTGVSQTEMPVYGLSRLGVYNKATATSTYEITDHLGNVRAVVQKNTTTGTTDIKSYADYYPFGEQLPGRNSNTGNYRYAFQGQELDPETGMEAFQLRLWDGRIGRWLSPDPYAQYASPYLGMGNNPVNMIDPDGGFAGGPGSQDPPGNWISRTFSSIGRFFSGTPDLPGTVLDEVVVYAKSSKSKSSDNIFNSYVVFDPWPNSKWDWFQNHQSGSIFFGNAPNNGSERDYGGKVGKDGTRYPTMDNEMATLGGGGGNPTFWKHKTNYVPLIVKFVRDYNGAAQQGSQLGDNLKIKKDTFFTVNFTYKRNEHQFSIMGLKGSQKVDSVKNQKSLYSSSTTITSIK